MLDRFVEAGGRCWTPPTATRSGSPRPGTAARARRCSADWLAGQPRHPRGPRRRHEGRGGAGGRRRRSRGCPRGHRPRGRAQPGRASASTPIDVYWAHGEDRRSTPRRRWPRSARWSRRRRTSAAAPPTIATWRVERARTWPREQGLEPVHALPARPRRTSTRARRVEVPGKDHRFGFVTDETVDYLRAPIPELELWVYSPLGAGQLRPRRPAVPRRLRASRRRRRGSPDARPAWPTRHGVAPVARWCWPGWSPAGKRRSWA